MCKYAALDLQMLRASQLDAALQDRQLCAQCRMAIESALLARRQGSDLSDDADERL